MFSIETYLEVQLKNGEIKKISMESQLIEEEPRFLKKDSVVKSIDGWNKNINVLLYEFILPFRNDEISVVIKKQQKRQMWDPKIPKSPKSPTSPKSPKSRVPLV
jgi:hypothetical protein